MLKLAISPIQWKKIKIPAARAAKLRPDDQIEVTIEVNRPNYVPDDVELRSRTDSMIFNGRTVRKALEKLDHDPKISSVEVGYRIHAPKTGGA